jgi:hypothetical protein
MRQFHDWVSRATFLVIGRFRNPAPMAARQEYLELGKPQVTG